MDSTRKFFHTSNFETVTSKYFGTEKVYLAATIFYSTLPFSGSKWGAAVSFGRADQEVTVLKQLNAQIPKLK
jgi:hypothetical protein